MRNERMHCKKGLAGIGAGSLIAALCLSACGVESAEEGATEEEGEAHIVGQEQDEQATVALQGRIDAIVGANPGARQISENEVELQQGAIVTVPRPRETTARGPGEPAAVLGTANCPYQYSCWYEHKNYDGERLAFKPCKFFNLANMRMADGRLWQHKISSWHNNQSGGAVAHAYSWNGSKWIWLFTTPVGKKPYVGDALNDKVVGISNCP